MNVQSLVLPLHAVLCLLLVIAAIGDLKARIIENWLTAIIALLAPLLWFALGYTIWPGMAIQLGIALAFFGLFTVFFALNVMGGGDVKLIGALALWFPLLSTVRLLLLMSIIGGLLTLAYWIVHKVRKSQTDLEIPYGVAIALAGLCVIYERYLNHFG